MRRPASPLLTLVGLLFASLLGLSATEGLPKNLSYLFALFSEDGTVLRVVDGDTIVVAIDGNPETIRFIGIDTPETVKPNAPIDCFGPEASAYTKERLTDARVRLEADPTQDDRDTYGRLLRYVYLDEELINETLVREGFAREYTYKKAYEHQPDFRAAEQYAKHNKRGLWDQCYAAP